MVQPVEDTDMIMQLYDILQVPCLSCRILWCEKVSFTCSIESSLRIDRRRPVVLKREVCYDFLRIASYNDMNIAPRALLTVDYSSARC